MYSVGVRDFASSSPLQVNWIIILVKVHAILLTMNITNKEHFISSLIFIKLISWIAPVSV